MYKEKVGTTNSSSIKQGWEPKELCNLPGSQRSHKWSSPTPESSLLSVPTFPFCILYSEFLSSSPHISPNPQTIGCSSLLGIPQESLGNIHTVYNGLVWHDFKLKKKKAWEMPFGKGAPGNEQWKHGGVVFSNPFPSLQGRVTLAPFFETWHEPLCSTRCVVACTFPLPCQKNAVTCFRNQVYPHGQME